MKLKLPEGFSIQWIEVTNRLCIHTKEDEYVCCNTLSDVVTKINLYCSFLEKIKETLIPDGFRLIPDLRYNKIMIIHNNNIVKGVDIENVSEELNNCLNMKLQIAALNNGEEIELP